MTERLQELKGLRERTEATQARLEEFEGWLRETESEIQRRRLHHRQRRQAREDNAEGGSTKANEEEEEAAMEKRDAEDFDAWCAHVVAMDEAVASVGRMLANHNGGAGSDHLMANNNGSLAVRTRNLQVLDSVFSNL